MPTTNSAPSHGVPAANEEALATSLVTQLFSMAGVELEDLSPFLWVGERWVADLPRALLVPTGGRSENLVFPRLDAIAERAWTGRVVDGADAVAARAAGLPRFTT